MGSERRDDLDLLARCADADLPRLVTQAAPALLSGNGTRLRPLLPRLRAVSTSGRPWVGLVLALAQHDADPAGTGASALAERSRAAFARRGDRRGEGLALYTAGNIAFGHGDIDDAVQMWAAGRALLGTESAAYAQALAKSSLGAYTSGNLRAALATAEEAVAVSVEGGLPRAEGMARVFVATICVWTGDFARAAASVARAREALLTVPPADRFELPMVDALDGVMAALRGDPPEAERFFAAGLKAADEVGAGSVEALVRVLRAHHCASWAAQRSLADARAARSVLRQRGDRWWSGGAQVATGTALAAGGDHAAAAATFERALSGDELFPLQRAYCRLLLGEQLLALSDHTRAVDALTQAKDRLERAGARFWAARACTVLAVADRSVGARHWARARELAGGDLAAERLFLGTHRFEVTLLGRPDVRVDGVSLHFPTRHARLVVFALAAAGARGLSSEVLQSWLWPEAERAVGSRRLRTALWQTRRVLGPAGGRLRRDGGRVLLSTGAGECDLADALAGAEGLLRQPEPPSHAVADVLARLAQPVLGGEEYGDWVSDLQDRVDGLRARLEVASAAIRRPPAAARPRRSRGTDAG
ncbi:MAG TPA: hypothetical protein VFM54_23730 [Micromonosporaceae bacterium]|nr:hypothetical protein [Micromonosporaceae bacterium]